MNTNLKKLLKPRSILLLKASAIIAFTLFLQSCSSGSLHEKNEDSNSVKVVISKASTHSLQ